MGAWGKSSTTKLQNPNFSGGPKWSMPGLAGGGNSTAGQVGGALGGLAGFMTANPLMGLILSQVGSMALEKIFGGGRSPYEQMQMQQANALKQQLPTIQAQAMGRPSPATQNQLAQLRQQTTRAQQSYGGSAIGRNVGQTTPTKMTQARFRTAETQAAGDILGNAQLAAQQQLIGLGVGGQAGLREVELQERQNRNQIYNDISTIMAEYRNAKTRTDLDPKMVAQNQQVIGWLNDIIKMLMSSSKG